MLKLFLIFLLISVFTACSTKKRDVVLQEQLKKDTTGAVQQIIFAEPQIIDSSHIIIYPLILERENGRDSYISSGGAQRTGYWNLIFYDTETQSQNLLTVTKRILITSIDFSAASSSTPEAWANGINIFKENIIYTAVAKDYNSNTILDQEDPSYLFISDRNGKNFRQLSPDDYNITSWTAIKGTTKIIMQGQKDNNGDNLFNEKDTGVPLIVDISSHSPSVEIFKQNFMDSVKQRLVTIWRQ